VIKLGNQVMDNITSLEGVVVGITRWQNGCVRIGVQAVDLKDGKPVDPIWFDEQRCVRVSRPWPRRLRSLVRSKSPAKRSSDFELGNKVRDVITGLEGVVDGITNSIGERISLCVQPVELHDGKILDLVYLDEERCVLVEPTRPQVSEDSDAGPGGPQCDPPL